MKRLIGLGMGMALLAVLAGVSPQEAKGQSAGLVSTLLSRMEQNRESLKSLRAGISMEKYNSQLRSSEQINGVIVYAPASGRNANVRIEWNKPHEILTVAKGQFWLYKPRLEVVYTGKYNGKSKRSNSGSITDLINLDRDQLQTSFEPFQDVREETLWGGVSTIHLKLVPKNGANFKYAEIWVDSSGMPIQTKVVEKNDDATTVRLSNLERNLKISFDQFSPKFESNVKVIKS